MILQPPKSASEPPPLPPSTRMSPQELIRRVSRVRYDLTTGQPIPFPTLESEQSLQHWIQRIEPELKDAGIPQTQWSDAAILFLEDWVSITMRKKRQHRLDLGIDLWPWGEFTAALLEELVARDSRPGAIQRFREEHPTAATVATTGLVIAGGAVLAPAIAVVGLNAVGFTSGGVAAGSIATGIQSIFYGGATTGLFSVCQAIGATAVAASPAVVISGVASVAAGLGLAKSSKPQNKEGNTPSEPDVPPPPPPYRT